MSQRYCKKPFEPGEIGGRWANGRMEIEERDHDGIESLVSCNFTACGVWASYELGYDPDLHYYICKRCLQQDGLLW